MKSTSLVILFTTLALAQDELPPVSLKRCKKEIVETYNLNGYLTPRPLNFYLCPAMKQSCCSLYDQFMIFSTWRDKIKVQFENYYKGIEKKLRRIRDLLKVLFHTNIKDLIEKLPMDEEEKDKLLQTFMLLKDKELYKLTDQVLGLYGSNTNFMMQLRSTFFCNICDFTSHRYIDIPSKILTIDEISCGDIAMNTINFSYFLNVELAKYLMDLAKLLGNFSIGGSDTPVSIKNYGKISSDVNLCANVFKSGSPDFEGCYRYCRYFKLSSNSPVIEGYQIFFNNVISSLEKFLKNHANQELPEAQGDDRSRLLNESSAQTGDDTDTSKNDDIETFDFSYDDLEPHDPYEETNTDPNYDDYVLDKMFSYEKNYVKDRRDGYVNFIRNKLYFSDSEYDYEKADLNNLFKTSSGIIVDFEAFRTQVERSGFDISKHLHTSNIDKSLKDLISHLKSRSQYKIMYEKLDPTLLEQINDISNEDVKNYHRDNFMHFKDFSLMLKHEEMLTKEDDYKKKLEQEEKRKAKMIKTLGKESKSSVKSKKGHKMA